MKRVQVKPRPRWVGAALVLLLSSCGWRAGLPVPAGGKSVGVEVFPTERFVLERDLEPILNTELSRAVVDYVGVPLESPGRADVVVRGEILEYHRRYGVRDIENNLIESGIYVSARAELVDGRTGKVLGPSQTAGAWSGYILDDAVANETAARERVMRNVAESLVLGLFQPAPEDSSPPDESALESGSAPY